MWLGGEGEGLGLELLKPQATRLKPDTFPVAVSKPAGIRELPGIPSDSSYVDEIENPRAVHPVGAGAGSI